MIKIFWMALLAGMLSAFIFVQASQSSRVVYKADVKTAEAFRKEQLWGKDLWPKQTCDLQSSTECVAAFFWEIIQQRHDRFEAGSVPFEDQRPPKSRTWFLRILINSGHGTLAVRLQKNERYFQHQENNGDKYWFDAEQQYLRHTAIRYAGAGHLDNAIEVASPLGDAKLQDRLTLTSAYHHYKQGNFPEARALFASLLASKSDTRCLDTFGKTLHREGIITLAEFEDKRQQETQILEQAVAMSRAGEIEASLSLIQGADLPPFSTRPKLLSEIYRRAGLIEEAVQAHLAVRHRAGAAIIFRHNEPRLQLKSPDFVIRKVTIAHMADFLEALGPVGYEKARQTYQETWEPLADDATHEALVRLLKKGALHSRFEVLNKAWHPVGNHGHYLKEKITSEYYETRAVAHMTAGELEKAEYLIRGFIKGFDKDKQLTALAGIYFDQGKEEKALQLLKGTKPFGLFSRGKSLLRRAHEAGARDFVLRALAIAPHVGSDSRFLRQIEKSGDEELFHAAYNQISKSGSPRKMRYLVPALRFYAHLGTSKKTDQLIAEIAEAVAESIAKDGRIPDGASIHFLIRTLVSDGKPETAMQLLKALGYPSVFMRSYLNAPALGQEQPTSLNAICGIVITG